MARLSHDYRCQTHSSRSSHASSAVCSASSAGRVPIMKDALGMTERRGIWKLAWASPGDTRATRGSRVLPTYVKFCRSAAGGPSCLDKLLPQFACPHLQSRILFLPGSLFADPITATPIRSLLATGPVVTFAVRCHSLSLEVNSGPLCDIRDRPHHIAHRPLWGEDNRNVVGASHGLRAQNWWPNSSRNRSTTPGTVAEGSQIATVLGSDA